MSNRFRPAWLLVLAALSTSALAKAPETVNIGYQKANIFALLKYRGTLDESLKKQGIAVRWVEFPAGPQMLEGLNVGSIDLAATGDAPPAFAQAAQADLVYLAHSPANPKTEAIVVPEQSAIHSVADLKGKRVGLNKGSDVNYLLVAALEKAGLSYKDITPVYLPPADARAAFQRGAIDAWVIWDPFLAEVETNAKARQIRNAEGWCRTTPSISPAASLQIPTRRQQSRWWMSWVNSARGRTAIRTRPPGCCRPQPDWIKASG